MEKFIIRKATKDDTGTVLSFIKKLAGYEKLENEVKATRDLLEKNLFGEKAVAKCLLGFYDGIPVCFSIYFYNFSTFLGKPGLYLEDLFVLPEYRGRGFGKAMLVHLARTAVEEDCGRFEWAVLDWNEPALKFYESLGAEKLDDWIIHRVTGEALQKLAKETVEIKDKTL